MNSVPIACALCAGFRKAARPADSHGRWYFDPKITPWIWSESPPKADPDLSRWVLRALYCWDHSHETVTAKGLSGLIAITERDDCRPSPILSPRAVSRELRVRKRKARV